MPEIRYAFGAGQLVRTAEGLSPIVRGRVYSVKLEVGQDCPLYRLQEEEGEGLIEGEFREWDLQKA